MYLYTVDPEKRRMVPACPDTGVILKCALQNSPNTKMNMNMKRLTSLLAALLCFCAMTAEAQAQTQVNYLVNSHAPVASRSCKIYKYNGTASSSIALSGGLKWRGGFTVGHTVGPYVPGFATFNLGGRYDRLMFVLGYENTGTGAGGSGVDTEPCIFTVHADGRKVLDRKIYPYGVPERITLDISGVNELKFQIVTGYAHIGVAEATLWTSGQTPKETGNLPTGKPKTIELVKDLKPYFQNNRIRSVAPDSKGALAINGVKYDYGLAADMSMAIIGNAPGWAYFNLRGAYEKLSFIAGPLDNAEGRHGKGWLTVKADGKIIWEYELNYDDIARQVTLDVSGCRMLSFHSEQEGGSTGGGIARIMAYPAGEQPQRTETDAPADPRLKALPDVCKLISNIPPYAAGAQVKQQIFDGSSDYITFSMGGVKFSEGFMLYQKANFLDNNLTSYAVFDLGGEFDYVSFTAGYIGKSQAMNDDLLRVYADDELALEVPLRATWPNQEYIVPIHKCRRLRFENKGSGKLSVAAFGVADIVVYRGQPVAHRLFEHPKPECPDEIDLLDLGAPYIHYVAPKQNTTVDNTIYYDGSTQRNYFTVGDRRVNKGFLLETSVHFSLDFGPLSEGSDNAAAGAIGSAAVGASFVAGTTAVGGAVVGSTLAGVAALLALAAGGEAVENSCAAFNTYGEYNSVTFTVACVRPNNAGHPSDYNETLLIGADHKVAAALNISETMEPQTVTVPIDGCRQLMFWLANTYNWSGVYAFYDIKLSKREAALDIPHAARRSEVVVNQPLWSGYTLSQSWKRPRSSGAKSLDEYHVKLSNACELLTEMLRRKPVYEINTYYLETDAGQVCKAVQLHSTINPTHAAGSYLSIVSEYREAARNLEKLYQLKRDLASCSVLKASAALDLPTLGFGAIQFGKIYKSANKALAECKQVLDLLLEEQRANTAFLQTVLDTGVDIDGKQSTERTVFCPLFAGETAPDGYLQRVEQFNVK